MAQQNYQQNRPQQQNKPQQTQHPTAPGTPATMPVEDPDKLTTAEQNRVQAALALGKEQEQEENDITQQQHQDPMTMFKYLLSDRIYQALVNPHEGQSKAKQDIRSWFESLPVEDKNNLRQEMVEAGRHMLRQVEDIVNDLPILTL